MTVIQFQVESVAFKVLFACKVCTAGLKEGKEGEKKDRNYSMFCVGNKY